MKNILASLLTALEILSGIRHLLHNSALLICTNRALFSHSGVTGYTRWNCLLSKIIRENDGLTTVLSVILGFLSTLFSTTMHMIPHYFDFWYASDNYLTSRSGVIEN
jgi:hypothetical protein